MKDEQNKITALPPKETLDKWANLTWKNCHDECLIEIADWLFEKTQRRHFESIRDGFKYIYEKHLELNRLTDELFTLRYCAESEMLNLAQSTCSKEVYNAILKCL